MPLSTASFLEEAGGSQPGKHPFIKLLLYVGTQWLLFYSFLLYVFLFLFRHVRAIIKDQHFGVCLCISAWRCDTNHLKKCRAPVKIAFP